MFEKLGAGSIKTRIKIIDSTTGLAKTGMDTSSAGLIISLIADTEASGTAYSGSNLETITTCGTYQAPTSGKVRFKEVDSTNHKGVYEIQAADARWAVSNSKSVIVSLQATGVFSTDKEVQLVSFDPYDAAALGLSRIDDDISSRLAATESTTLSAIKDQTDLLPSSPAATGDEMTLTSAYDAAKTAASQASVDAIQLDVNLIQDTVSKTVSIGVSNAIVAYDYTLTTGNLSSGSLTNTQTLDGIYHIHTDASGQLEIEYSFNIGGGNSPSSLVVTTYLQGANDSLEVYAWNYETEEYARIGTRVGTVNPVSSANTYKLLSSMVDTDGEILIKFTDGAFTLTSATFAIDFMYVEYARVLTAETIATTLLDLADGVETDLTLRQAMRINTSAAAGLVSGAETTEVTIRDVNDTKDRIVATVDESGNRTEVILDVS